MYRSLKKLMEKADHRATLMLGRYLSHGSKFGDRMFRNKVVEYAEKEA